MPQFLRHWLRGVRIYIAIGIIVLALDTWWWAAASYAGTSLLTIRLEEAYAWYSVTLLAVALSIGPALKLFPRLPGRKLWFDARRLIGVGAATFASLHVLLVYGGLFGFVNPLSIPRNYQAGVWYGLFAWIVLLVMAFTSFDKAFHKLGAWWFRIHRFVYAAAAVTILHVFLIGTHGTSGKVQLLFAALALWLVAAQALVLRIKDKPFSRWRVATLVFTSVSLIIIFGFGLGHHSVIDTRSTP